MIISAVFFCRLGEVRDMDNTELVDTVKKLKRRIIEIEAGKNDLSETDTRQGLINPLFRALGWDFSDFDILRGFMLPTASAR